MNTWTYTLYRFSMTVVSAKWEDAFSAGFRQAHHSVIYLMFVDFAWNELPKVVSKSNQCLRKAEGRRQGREGFLQLLELARSKGYLQSVAWI